MGKMAPRDLTPTKYNRLSWEKGKVIDSLDTLFDYICLDAVSCADWYVRAKRKKQWWAWILRAVAIVLGVVAGIIPVIGQMFPHIGRFTVYPAWASVVLATAAALIVFDRFFGFSSGWMRYMSTELNLRQMVQEFQLDWETERSAWMGLEPTADQLRATFVRFKAFLTEVNGVVRKETADWIQEFQSALTQIDEVSKAKDAKQLGETFNAHAAIGELGALNVTLTNGDACDDGWIISVDKGDPAKGHGKTVGLRGLVPGVHLVQVSGSIAGKAKHAESAILIASGAIATVELALA